MFVLAWYVYPVMAATVVGSMMLAYWWVSRQERREDEAAGPRPCLEHMGTGPNDISYWCQRAYNHDGTHEGWFAGPEPDDLGLFPEYVESNIRSAEQCDFVWEFPTGTINQCLYSEGHDGMHAYTADQVYDQNNPAQPRRL